MLYCYFLSFPYFIVVCWILFVCVCVCTFLFTFVYVCVVKKKNYILLYLITTLFTFICLYDWCFSCNNILYGQYTNITYDIFLRIRITGLSVQTLNFVRPKWPLTTHVVAGNVMVKISLNHLQASWSRLVKLTSSWLFLSCGLPFPGNHCPWKTTRSRSHSKFRLDRVNNKFT